MQIICVPAIVAAVYWIIELYKVLAKKEKLLKIIPLIAGALGGGLGIVLFYAAPEIVIADTWYIALVIGVASGLAAVGENQIFKQLKKIWVDVKEPEEKEREK